MAHNASFTIPITTISLALAFALAAACNASASFFTRSSSSSRCRSYPNCLIRPASSSAFRSASAKSTGLVRDAPSPSLDFLGAVLVPRPDELEFELRRDTPPSLFERPAEADVMVRGAAAGVTLGDGVRPITGGVDTLGVGGAEDLGVAGLDHELKKSSSVSSFETGVAEACMPSTKIPLGKLIGK